MSQYYTPSTEEFHVGFEYEVSVEDTGFHKRIWDKKSEGQYLMLTPCSTRVKYLDQKDIESFGFEKAHSHPHPENDDYLFGVPRLMKDNGPTGNGFWLKLKKKTGQVEITDCTGLFHKRLFDGVVKNKSELKRVLTQIGFYDE